MATQFSESCPSSGDCPLVLASQIGVKSRFHSSYEKGCQGKKYLPAPLRDAGVVTYIQPHLIPHIDTSPIDRVVVKWANPSIQSVPHEFRGRPYTESRVYFFRIGQDQSPLPNEADDC